MRHLTEEELVETYYGESGESFAIEHLARCPGCASRFARLKGFLDDLAREPVPEPQAGWTDSVWSGLEPKLESPGWAWNLLANRRKVLTLAAGLIVVVAIGLLAGRVWRQERPHPADPTETAASRMLSIVLSEHLARSQVLLTELSHQEISGAAPPVAGRETARELLGLNRVYRRAAEEGGAFFIAELLEQLEVTLIQVANLPPEYPGEDFRLLLSRMDTRELILRLQVIRREIEIKAESGRL